MSDILIQTATLKDFGGIQDVVKEVWPIAYRDVITTEQIKYMLEKMYDDTSLRKQLLEEKCEFILAKRNDAIVGFASSSATSDNLFKLHKLYVLTTEQGKGTGKKLLEEVCVRAKNNSAEAIELQVNKKNSHAISFYKKNGFFIDQEAVFDIGNGFIMDDFIMKRVL